jgi:hypothetical protein
MQLPKHERRRRSTAVASEMEKHHYVAWLEMLSALRRPLSDSIEVWSLKKMAMDQYLLIPFLVG